MTRTLPPAPAQTNESTPPDASAIKPDRSRSAPSVLEKLFELYPHLFGAKFLPLKLGVFQELLSNHPECFERSSLKAALGMHTRSTRYLQSVAAGEKRHDLQGSAVEDVSPEHVYLALLELFRRRQARAREDLRPKFRAQLSRAFEASGLARQEYLARVQTNDLEATALLEEALAEHHETRARQDALLRAFESSGKTADEFADMYGMDIRAVTAALQRKPRQAG